MGDRPSSEIIDIAQDLLRRYPGILCYLKWTCPGCGDRVTANNPNSFATQGYLHEDCGYVYKGDQFGLMIVQVLSAQA